jgi:hypothetical protein
MPKACMIITTKLHTLSVLLLVMQKTNFAFSELIDELHSTMQVQNIVSKTMQDQNLWLLRKQSLHAQTLDGLGSQAATNYCGTATQLHFHEATSCIHSFADYKSHVRYQLRHASSSGERCSFSEGMHTSEERTPSVYVVCHESDRTLHLKPSGRSHGALSCTPPRLFDAWSEELFWPGTKFEDILENERF